MAILDNTVVNVALPTLERVFNVDLELLLWVVTGYILAQAAVIPLSGWLADGFGGKIVYLTAMATFVTGSTLCAIAPTSSMLIGFRVVQGLGGGMLLPLGLALIFRLSPPEQRGSIMGALSLPVLVAPALGPVVSGWLLGGQQAVHLPDQPVEWPRSARPRLARIAELRRIALAGAFDVPHRMS